MFFFQCSVILVDNFRELGENLSDEELRAMIDEFDKNGDGESKLDVTSIGPMCLKLSL